MKTYLPFFFMCLFWHLASVSSVQAQFHFQGLKGINIEYGVQARFEQHYSIGYQFFLTNHFQIEINGGYEQGAYLAKTQYLHYDAASEYQVKNLFLYQSIDYSFLRLLKRWYFNLGAGLTQAFEEVNITSMSYSIDSARLEANEEVKEFDPEAVRLNSKLRIGGHANLLTEFFLCRYVTLLARHRLVYIVDSHYGPWVQQTTVGIRINF